MVHRSGVAASGILVPRPISATAEGVSRFYCDINLAFRWLSHARPSSTELPR